MDKKIIYGAVAIILATIIVIGILINSQKQDLPDLCIVLEPNYLLACMQGNETIAVTATWENIDIALEKNNCTITDRKDIIDIIYCYQENNLTKYKINIQKFKYEN